MQSFKDTYLSLMTINELAVRYGVSLRTLRFYEERGLLCPRRERTSRLYSKSDEIRLQLILKGKKLGFSLNEISELIAATEKSGEPERELVLPSEVRSRQLVRLEQRREDVDRAIDELRSALA